MKFRVLGYNVEQGQTLVDVHILGEDEYDLVVPIRDHELLTRNGLILAVELGLHDAERRYNNVAILRQAYREDWVLDTEEHEGDCPPDCGHNAPVDQVQPICSNCVDGECQCGKDVDQQERIQLAANLTKLAGSGSTDHFRDLVEFAQQLVDGKDARCAECGGDKETGHQRLCSAARRNG